MGTQAVAISSLKWDNVTSGMEEWPETSIFDLSTLLNRLLLNQLTSQKAKISEVVKWSVILNDVARASASLQYFIIFNTTVRKSVVIIGFSFYINNNSLSVNKFTTESRIQRNNDY